MWYAKCSLPYTIIVISAMAFVAANAEINEVCDVEGSSPLDCSADTHCCEQSVCDNEITEHLKKGENSGNRTQCCNKADRDKIPFPDHCSKCPTCGENLTGIASSLYYTVFGVNSILFI